MSHPPIPRRHPPPPPPLHYPPPPRLLPPSTFTYIASWRGQLLICTVVLLLGSIWYFVVQGPLAAWSRKRREKRSAALSKELLEAEDSKEREKDRLAVPLDTKKAAVQSRKTSNASEGKRRKGSILKVPTEGSPSGNASGGEKERKMSTSKGSRNPSASPSPAAEKKPLPSLTTVPAESRRRPSSTARDLSPTVPPPPSQPIIRVREPTEEVNPPKSPPSHTLHTPPNASSSTLPSAFDPSTPPHLVPLPISPVAGPSRLPTVASEDSISGSAEGSVVDDGDDEEATSGSRGRGYKKSEGFSIMPDPTYLPAPAPSSGKKKKKKGRGSANPLPALAISPFPPDEFKARKASSAGSTGDEADPSQSTRATKETKEEKLSHSRQASLGRPTNMSLEEILDHREKTIDNLRAEIGIAKAEEGKAREEVARMKSGQETLSEQMRRARKPSGGRESEVFAQRRESELTARLQHVTIAYENVSARLIHLEAYLRDANIPIPAAPMLIHAQSPHSPYHMVNYPSPHGGRGSPMPSPMFPSPHGYHPSMSPQMLYPGFAQYRSSSVGHVPLHHDTENMSLAGPLTPGLNTSHMISLSPLSPYAVDVSRGRPGSQSINTGESLEEMDEPRRKSIALEVMKKKADHPGAMSTISTTGSAEGDEKTTSSSPSLSSNARELDSATSESVHGLGVGDIEKSEGASFTGPIDEEVLAEEQDREQEPSDAFRRGRACGGSVSTAGSSHPTSPSPRRTLLCTPANAELYRLMTDASPSTIPLHLSRPSSRNASDAGGEIKGIKVVSDGEGGTVYFREDEDGQDGLSEGGSQREREQTAKLPNGHAHVPQTSGTPYESHLHNSTATDSPIAEEAPEGEELEYEYQPPMFASLAHTDAQRAEMDRMRRASQSRTSKSRSTSANATTSAPLEEASEEVVDTQVHERVKTT